MQAPFQEFFLDKSDPEAGPLGGELILGFNHRIRTEKPTLNSIFIQDLERTGSGIEMWTPGIMASTIRDGGLRSPSFRGA